MGMIGAGLGIAKGLFWVGFSLLLGLGSLVAGMEGGGFGDNSYLQLVLVCDAATVLFAAVGFWGAGLVLAAGENEQHVTTDRLRKGLWLTLASAAGIAAASTVYAVLFPIVVPGDSVGVGAVYYVSAFGPAAIVFVAAVVGVEVRRRRHFSGGAIQS